MKSKRNLVSKHLSVFTYTDQGALLEDQPFVQNDCYYHGYIDEDPESMVAVTTCFGGLLGSLQINGRAYEIKPKNFSSTFEHLIYKMDSRETESFPMGCGLTKEEIAHQLKVQGDAFTLRQSSSPGWWTRGLTVEFTIVVDNRRFVYRDRNISQVHEDVITVLNIINAHFSPLEVVIVLMALEIWNKENLIDVETKLAPLLRRFCTWKKQNLDHHVRHDVGHLFVNYPYGISTGMAYVGGVCHSGFNCGIESFRGSSATSFAQTVSHELGHNLGMLHDENKDTCTCGRESCIMHPTKGDGVTFSNCSFDRYFQTSYTKACLQDSPNKQDIVALTKCGNGMVENGEECDCGTLQLCLKDPCCQDNCVLKPHADCARGFCCKNCHFMSSGTVCRAKHNECDLPEWCYGNSSTCPDDVYVSNGRPCHDGGHCYGKKCINSTIQCQQIFGKEAKNAAKSCYLEMNTRGDRFGNCGIINRGQYVKCNISDILCGQIQCENVTRIPHLRSHYTVHLSHYNGVTCWGTDYHLGMTRPDIGDVEDGTGCAPNHMCMNRKCVHMSALISHCSPKTCSLNGICNNRDHCHCNPEWSPPHCKAKGRGGSVDSGPPPVRRKSRFNDYTLGLLIAFWVIFCLFLISTCLRNNKRHNVKTSLETEQRNDRIKEEPNI